VSQRGGCCQGKGKKLRHPFQERVKLDAKINPNTFRQKKKERRRVFTRFQAGKRVSEAGGRKEELIANSNKSGRHQKGRENLVEPGFLGRHRYQKIIEKVTGTWKELIRLPRRYPWGLRLKKGAERELSRLTPFARRGSHPARGGR